MRNPGNDIVWRFTDNKKDITWKNKTYISVTMDYKPPSTRDGLPSGGSLEIDPDLHREPDGYELLRWFDEADDKAEMEVIAVIDEQGEITETANIRHGFGTVNWDGQKITWNLGEEDRFQMQVNPWVFDESALTG
jgi:hypothetical protein